MVLVVDEEKRDMRDRIRWRGEEEIMSEGGCKEKEGKGKGTRCGRY